MASFTTRVLLNGYPTADDYTRLHGEMKRRGFSRVIKSDDGAYYWLPSAEYNRQGNVTLQQVLNDAKTAANSVKTPNEVLVTDAKARMWNGLRKATAGDAAAA
jgi:hypothetical protein